MRLAIREALLAFRRTPLLSTLSITTIAFSLFAFGLFGLVALNIRDALQRVEERVEIRAFIADGTPVETAAAALEDIAAFPEVQRPVAFVTPEQALERAKRELGEFSDVFEGTMLPASIDVKLKPGFRDPTTVKIVAERVQAYPFVEDVRYGEEWVEKLDRLRKIMTAAGLVLGVAFAAVAVIIIGATIRMAVLARGREIQLMRLVGATDTFIRSPFLLDGVAKGVIGGALALLLTRAASSAISVYFIETRFFDNRAALIGIAGGALMGLLGSALSVSRHLQHTPMDRRKGAG
ncbi:MAG TPA: permease-like cell division protein FtsX [Gemmatimonadaceae bacterium]|nr:permease-like cell division protein FtsX [Gemmatimonadaceae bacterium]